MRGLMEKGKSALRQPDQNRTLVWWLDQADSVAEIAYVSNTLWQENTIDRRTIGQGQDGSPAMIPADQRRPPSRPLGCGAA
jgi:hypothetical protein